MPGTPKTKVKSRIILTPTHAKRFMKAMIENVKKFEFVNAPDKGGITTSRVFNVQEKYTYHLIQVRVFY